MRSRSLAILASFVAAVVTAPLAAQTSASLTLRVIAKDSGAPLPGAQLAVRGGLRASADADGWARVETIPPGMHMVEVRHIGYAPEQFLMQFAPGADIRDRVVMEPAPVELASVAVSAARGNRALQSNGFYERQRAGLGTFLDREQIDKVGQGRSTVSSVLRTVPGVRFLVPPGGRGLVVTTSRSAQLTGVNAGSCASQVILDGIVIQPVQSAGRAEVVIIDDVVALDEIEAIEWYRGPAQTPPQFNQTGRRGLASACGTVVIWTRAGAPNR